MQGILYEESSIFLFALVTVLMGGWAAWQTGKAIARTWKPLFQLVLSMLLLGMAVRFIHFALFEGTLFSLRYYIVDTIVVMAAGFAGWRVERARAMARQYGWLYERSGPFGWVRRDRPQQSAQ